MELNFTTPVLFIIFNRPDFTHKVFAEIRKVRPRQLFIAADGPRNGIKSDNATCSEARKIINAIDWECNVHTLFNETNSGCGRAPAKAITWFFENVNEGIILEDDCLPSEEFFVFCQKMLEKYRDDNRIMHICGSNFQFGKKRGDGSYYFSRYPEMWGWASWKRAWNLYDFELSAFSEFERSGIIKEIISNQRLQKYWIKNFRTTYQTDNPTWWDYQWIFAVWKNKGLCIQPNANLVSNIGFRQDATHTRDIVRKDAFVKIDRFDVSDIISPSVVMPDNKADEYAARSRYLTPLYIRAGYRLKRLWNRFV